MATRPGAQEAAHGAERERENAAGEAPLTGAPLTARYRGRRRGAAAKLLAAAAAAAHAAEKVAAAAAAAPSLAAHGAQHQVPVLASLHRRRLRPTVFTGARLHNTFATTHTSPSTRWLREGHRCHATPTSWPRPASRPSSSRGGRPLRTSGVALRVSYANRPPPPPAAPPLPPAPAPPLGPPVASGSEMCAGGFGATGSGAGAWSNTLSSTCGRGARAGKGGQEHQE